MTPVEIRVLLHYHALCDEPDYINSSQLAKIREDFMHFGLIRISGDTYTTTPRGAKMVEMLCNVPLPVQVWGDPR